MTSRVDQRVRREDLFAAFLERDLVPARLEMPRVAVFRTAAFVVAARFALRFGLVALLDADLVPGRAVAAPVADDGVTLADSRSVFEPAFLASGFGPSGGDGLMAAAAVMPRGPTGETARGFFADEVVLVTGSESADASSPRAREIMLVIVDVMPLVTASRLPAALPRAPPIVSAAESRRLSVIPSSSSSMGNLAMASPGPRCFAAWE